MGGFVSLDVAVTVPAYDFMEALKRHEPLMTVHAFPLAAVPVSGGLSCFHAALKAPTGGTGHLGGIPWAILAACHLRDSLV